MNVSFVKEGIILMTMVYAKTVMLTVLLAELIRFALAALRGGHSWKILMKASAWPANNLVRLAMVHLTTVLLVLITTLRRAGNARITPLLRSDLRLVVLLSLLSLAILTLLLKLF